VRVFLLSGRALRLWIDAPDEIHLHDEWRSLDQLTWDQETGLVIDMTG
jgi:hypothetical protein